MPFRLEHEFLEPDYQSGKAKPPNRFTVRAFEKGTSLVIGTAMFWLEGRNWLFPERVDVLTDYRRQGIATVMYQRAEAVTGRKIRKSRDQSDYGRLLWKRQREQRGFGYMRVPGRRELSFGGLGAKPRLAQISAHREGPHWLYVEWFALPEGSRGQGLGRQEWGHFERSLPKDVHRIRLHAADSGRGSSGPFWEAMGFEYRYSGDEEDDLSIESQQEMWKGVNGHPLPGRR